MAEAEGTARLRAIALATDIQSNEASLRRTVEGFVEGELEVLLRSWGHSGIDWALQGTQHFISRHAERLGAGSLVLSDCELIINTLDEDEHFSLKALIDEEGVLDFERLNRQVVTDSLVERKIAPLAARITRCIKGKVGEEEEEVVRLTLDEGGLECQFLWDPKRVYCFQRLGLRPNVLGAKLEAEVRRLNKLLIEEESSPPAFIQVQSKVPAEASVI